MIIGIGRSYKFKSGTQCWKKNLQTNERMDETTGTDEWSII